MKAGEGRRRHSFLARTIFMHMAAVLVAGGGVFAGDGAANEDWKPNRVDYAMYYLSEVKDAPNCSMTVQDGKVVIGDGITNPAMTCPDMFSWKLFAEVIQDEFWWRWAGEKDNWPPQPYRLCRSHETPDQGCCKPGDPGNHPHHCPSWPGDVNSQGRFGDTPDAPRELMKSLTDHLFTADFQHEIDALPENAAIDSKTESGDTKPTCADYPLPDEVESIGRVIRFTNGGLTVRNRSFHDYLFENDLYNVEGVAAVFERNQQNIPKRAPYRLMPVPSHEPEGLGVSKIELPVDAIMIKSNWMNAELLKKISEKYGWDFNFGDHSYVKKKMKQKIKLGEGMQAVEYDCDGEHYLMAFHISSKDIPNWVWTTFEHVNLPGRCDITGCNDSWGYFSSDADIPRGGADNYVRPKTRSEKAVHGGKSSLDIFDRDRIYGAEEIRPQLAHFLDALNIGSGTRPSESTSPSDPAWRNYRLKGSQVEYVDATGRPTLLGNSVTEAGFLDGSSCITCHARAGSDVYGPSPKIRSSCGEIRSRPGCKPSLPLSVFVNDLSDFGYGKSANGVPDPNWFNESNQPQSLRVMQTDFVWGFLRARPLVNAQ